MVKNFILVNPDKIKKRNERIRVSNYNRYSNSRIDEEYFPSPIAEFGSNRKDKLKIDIYLGKSKNTNMIKDTDYKEDMYNDMVSSKFKK